MAIIAETERLTLRFFNPDDQAVIDEILSNPQVMKFAISGPLDREQAQLFLNNVLDTYRSRGFSLWAVHSKEAERVIGFCGHFFHRLDGRNEVELVYRLLPKYWGQGLASEAAFAATHYAFNQLELKRLISFIAQDNLASKKVAQLLGFKLERETYIGDKPVLVYSLEKAEFK